MISLARKNAIKKGLKPPHVVFVEALLTEALPIESNSVDCVLSNCVINLLPMEGKASLSKEVHRILKPGGRVVLDDVRSDLLLLIFKQNFLFIRILPFRSSPKNNFQIISYPTLPRTSVVYLERFSRRNTRHWWSQLVCWVSPRSNFMSNPLGPEFSKF